MIILNLKPFQPKAGDFESYSDEQERIADRNTPEGREQGLGLPHIGNVAPPEVNVEDVHQATLEQLGDARGGG